MKIGVSYPYNNNTNTVFKFNTLTREQIQSNIRYVFSINVGEMYMNPRFGSNLRNILFQNISDFKSFEAEIKQSILTTFTEFLPYCEVQNIIVNFETDNYLSITIVYSTSEVDYETIILNYNNFGEIVI